MIGLPAGLLGLEQYAIPHPTSFCLKSRSSISVRDANHCRREGINDLAFAALLPQSQSVLNALNGGLLVVRELEPQQEEIDQLKLVEKIEIVVSDESTPVEPASAEPLAAEPLAAETTTAEPVQAEATQTEALSTESISAAAAEAKPVEVGAAGQTTCGRQESVSDGEKSDWIKDYEVIEKIGEGSLTTVYKVKRSGIEEFFVAKVLRSEFASNPRTSKRFLQEAEKAVKLNNAHIVSVYEVGKTLSGVPYLICDRFDAGSLADRLSQTEPMAQVEVLHLFLQVAEGLNHAHKNDLIHRDIKPANIVFKTGAAAELVKLADLGIAKVLPGAGRETKYFTPFGEAFGNPSYMSPEQLKGARLDARADIYSLGCVMYECLCGQPPFEDQNAVKVAMRQIHEDALPLRDRAAEQKVSAGVEAIVMRMIEKDAAVRYQSVEELIEDMKLVRAGGSPRPAPPPPVVAHQSAPRLKQKVGRLRLHRQLMTCLRKVRLFSIVIWQALPWIKLTRLVPMPTKNEAINNHKCCKSGPLRTGLCHFATWPHCARVLRPTLSNFARLRPRSLLTVVIWR